MTDSSHGLVLLAAGVSRRLGRSKAMLQHHGETLLHRAARLGLATAPLDAVLVVGVANIDTLRSAIVDLPIRAIECAQASLGMGASLAAGCAALDLACAGALVLQLDQWQLPETHLSQVLHVWQQQPQAPVASAYAGVLGVPAILPRSWFARLPARSDIGARDLLREAQPPVRSVPCAALAMDLDEMTDLAVFQRAQRTPPD